MSVRSRQMYLVDLSPGLNVWFACLIHSNQQIQPNSTAPDGFYQPFVWSKGEDPHSPPCLLSGCDLPPRNHLSSGGYWVQSPRWYAKAPNSGKLAWHASHSLLWLLWEPVYLHEGVDCVPGLVCTSGSLSSLLGTHRCAHAVHAGSAWWLFFRPLGVFAFDCPDIFSAVISNAVESLQYRSQANSLSYLLHGSLLLSCNIWFIYFMCCF